MIIPIAMVLALKTATEKTVLECIRYSSLVMILAGLKDLRDIMLC